MAFAEVLADAEAMLAMLRRARRSIAKDWDEDAHPRGDDGRFGAGGGAADKPAGRETRDDGKAYYRPPPAVGAPDHPNQRDAAPTKGPDYREGTRTDPKMWEQDKPGGPHFYSGGDEHHEKPHEWPTAKGDPKDADKLVGSIRAGTAYKEMASQTLRNVAAAHPVAAWAMEAHPPPELRMTPIAGNFQAGGQYNHVTGQIHVNTNMLDKGGSDRPFKMGDSWSVASDAKTPEARAAGVFLHEYGHHLSSAPGVEKIMTDGWTPRRAGTPRRTTTSTSPRAGPRTTATGRGCATTT